jgi:hypothetical protein
MFTDGLLSGTACRGYPTPKTIKRNVFFIRTKQKMPAQLELFDVVDNDLALNQDL